MLGNTVEETTANILSHKHAAKDTGRWLKNSRDTTSYMTFGKSCSKPMDSDKARRIAGLLHRISKKY